MPVDKSKPPKTNAKRPQDVFSANHISQSIPGSSGIIHARELEVKRSRGEVSCAECRRLKIKCDKQIPCQSCVRRGCSALCPNGALATGQGTRFVLAATEHLHRKIARMGERIRILEDALTALHASKGNADVHPLIADGEDFTVNTDDSQTPSTSTPRRVGDWDVLDATSEGKTPGPNPDVIDAFGTLSISDHGISRFFGPTGGSESLLLANLTGTPSTQSTSASGSPSSFSLSNSHSSQSLSPASTHASAPESPARTNANAAAFAPPSAARCSTSPYAASTLVSPSDSPATLFSSSAFPLTPIGPPQAVHALVTSHLPSRRHARKLVQCYFSQLAWLFRGVTQGQVVDMMRGVYAAYGSRHDSASPGELEEVEERGEEEEDGDDRDEDEDYTGPHDLALLFLIFAAGALVQPPAHGGTEDDVHRREVGAEAEHLHQIARAALALQPVLEKPSLVTIQALHLLSIYISLASPGTVRYKNGEEDADTSMEMTWSLITLAAHLSQTIGLHRDSARWGLSPKMVQRRRILFWDLFVADVWTSLNTGRPPSFSLAYIDCSFPTYENDKARDALFEVWQFRFAAECVAEVTSRTLTAEAPSYSTIMELDRKVREFPVPSVFDDALPEDVGASLQRCVLEHVRETVLMYIHRSFFAQAIIEQPMNPLKSTYAPSFLAAYRSSATILKSVREQYAVMPNACGRFWTMWTFAFTAAVVFGTVVTRGPRSPLASSAMTELDQACVLFSKAAVYSRRAQKALPILTKLSEKARLALSSAQNDPSGGDDSGVLWNMAGVLGPDGLPVKAIKKEEPEDELSIFAGHTRFVSGQVQRAQHSSLAFPSQPLSAPPPPEDHMPIRQLQQRPQGQPMQDEMSYGSYDASPQRRFPVQYPAQERPQPRQRQVSMPNTSSFHVMHDMRRPAPTVNVNVNMTWDPREYPQSAHDYHASPHSAVEERMPPQHPHQQQSHAFYAPNGTRTQHSIPPPPSAPYAWPVDSYGTDDEPQPQYAHHHSLEEQRHPHHYQHPQHPQHAQHSQHPQHPQHAQHSQHTQHPQHSQQQQHQYDSAQSMYPHPQHTAAYQSHNAQLAQLGLAARDSRLDERWSNFMEDSGLLEGIDFRSR
ncbi:Zn(2)-C6 fungal-type domain-containing protein [Favolaschia claudopus]|uniref:Zn(2)-C6 fungal-type domain-containing protein n=1 Tax=Favolaschia claudopus TaxID=2862362 RepID=A0AAW0DLE5_9AGAR